MSELPDQFISALLRDGSAEAGNLNVDLDSAYAGVARRVQHVRRRRVALVSGAACVALFGAVLFAGSRMGASDDGQPGGPATDQRGNLIPDVSDVSTTTATPPATTVELTTVNATVPLETAPPTVVGAAESPAGGGGLPAATPSNHSGNGGGPSTTDDHGGPSTTDDGLHSGSDSSGHDVGSGESHGG